MAASFSNILQFWDPFGIQFGILFGVPVNLGNRVKTLKRVRFSHFGTLFAGMISRLDLASDLLSIFLILDVFRTSFWDVFWDNYAIKWSAEK